jgi:hypothetical protein
MTSHQAKRILIFRPNGIGDAVVSLSAAPQYLASGAAAVRAGL